MAIHFQPLVTLHFTEISKPRYLEQTLNVSPYSTAIVCTPERLSEVATFILEAAHHTFHIPWSYLQRHFVNKTFEVFRFAFVTDWFSLHIWYYIKFIVMFARFA